MSVWIDNISKRYGSNTVFENLSLDIKDGEFVSLIGPSGVGETTILMILTQLLLPDEGTVRFACQPSKRNPVIMVFQDFALFPHMNVMENIGYGLKVRGIGKLERLKRVEEMLEWFVIAEKAYSFPNKLSAGQKQRTAIARALIVKPMALLLDAMNIISPFPMARLF